MYSTVKCNCCQQYLRNWQPWSTVLLEKSKVAGPVKKFPALCATWKFITASTRARHCFTIRTFPYCSLVYIWILSYRHRVCVRNGLIPVGFLIKFFYLYIPLCYDIGIINRPFIATHYLQHVSACTAIIRYYSCKILSGRWSAIVRLTTHSVVTLTVDIIVTACGLYTAAIRL
jgi:hypothetical protein